MTPEQLLALALFAIATSITPGPNNIMLLSSGANFGFRRTMPHMLGVGLGFCFLLFCCGIGIAQLFTVYPQSRTALTIISVAYLLWLAWKTGTAAGTIRASRSGKPLTFLQAAAFQWVNPKGIAMALGAITAYAPGQQWSLILLVILVFGVLNVACISLWTLMGQEIARWLTSHRRRLLFNWTMAGLIVLSLIPVLRP